MGAAFQRAAAILDASSNVTLRGIVSDVAGTIIEGAGITVPVGAQVVVEGSLGEIAAQVVGFKNEHVLIMPYGEIEGVSPGCTIRAMGADPYAHVGDYLLGKVVNAFGESLDQTLLLGERTPLPLLRKPPNPVQRRRIEKVFDTGVRAINALLTVGVGQRIGIMAGSGVGKSTLLGMIAKHSSSDVNVIALVGERGREVREFIERDLGPEGMARSVVVVATSDDSPLVRIRAALYATTVAEFFRDQGKQVCLMMDSVTRLAMAQREVGLAIGEPPSTRGYTPSVFAMLPKLLERAGTSPGEGSITGLYTVLVEGDDMNEPVADTVRGILDGHFVLSRQLAARGHYPALDVLQSISRVMSDIADPEHYAINQQARDMLATYRENEDLITIGAYKPGVNPRVDMAISKHEALTAFLKQSAREAVSIEQSVADLGKIFAS